MLLVAEFGDAPIEWYALKLTMDFQQQLVHLPSSWLVSQATLFSQHLARQGFNMWKPFFIGKTMTTQHQNLL